MSLIPWLDSSNQFPDIHLALDEPNGLLAAGGDLSPERLLNAYKHGIFPWFDDKQPILWWSPSPRCVLIPKDIHISKSLAKFIRKMDFRISFDEAFEQVIAACAAPRSYSNGTWITEDMQAAYTTLHQTGYAHSLEVWDKQQLIGGLYGINIGKLFFGESMFSRAPNASKVAFVALARQCEAWGFPLIDCQIPNPHLSSLGATEINREAFQQVLHCYAAKEQSLEKWTFDKKLCLTHE
jgi:leucyl/phenylalanyl-tRNA--protein transferase